MTKSVPQRRAQIAAVLQFLAKDQCKTLDIEPRRADTYQPMNGCGHVALGDLMLYLLVAWPTLEAAGRVQHAGRRG